MLPVVLVLLVASSAFSFPTVGVSLHPIQEIALLKDPGRRMSNSLSQGILDLFDGGEKSIYSLTLGLIIDDIANLPDSTSQAIAIAQVLGAIGELAYGIPGDSCAAAAAINEAVSEVSTGQAIAAWRGRLASNIDVLYQLATNPDNLKYRVGPQGKCAGGGRTYQFEAAWDLIRNAANPYNVALLNEEYCATRRLYQANNIRSNNIGAAVTASAMKPIVNVIRSNMSPFLNFMKLAMSGASEIQLASAAAACKSVMLG